MNYIKQYEINTKTNEKQNQNWTEKVTLYQGQFPSLVPRSSDNSCDTDCVKDRVPFTRYVGTSHRLTYVTRDDITIGPVNLCGSTFNGGLRDYLSCFETPVFSVDVRKIQETLFLSVGGTTGPSYTPSLSSDLISVRGK